MTGDMTGDMTGVRAGKAAPIFHNFHRRSERSAFAQRTPFEAALVRGPQT